jgi:hypothetical protein
VAITAAAQLTDEKQLTTDAGLKAGATNPETLLMQRIYARWHQSIQSSIGSSPIPPEFIAALIANESGGDENAQKFEPTVLAQLQAVRDGKVRSFGKLAHHDLAGLQDVALKAMATSYGLLQIMGYLGPVDPRGNPLPEILTIPARNLSAGRDMILEFCREWYLNPREDFHGLFRCWNTGRPDAATTDPAYVSNGLARMAIYRKIAGGAK